MSVFIIYAFNQPITVIFRKNLVLNLNFLVIALILYIFKNKLNIITEVIKTS